MITGRGGCGLYRPLKSPTLNGLMSLLHDAKECVLLPSYLVAIFVLEDYGGTTGDDIVCVFLPASPLLNDHYAWRVLLRSQARLAVRARRLQWVFI